MFNNEEKKTQVKIASVFGKDGSTLFLFRPAFQIHESVLDTYAAKDKIYKKYIYVVSAALHRLLIW